MFAVLLTAGCGGPAAPTAPAVPAPVPVEVRDGWTGNAINPGVSPGVGSLVTPLQPVMGSTVNVSAPGYLPRIQILSGPVYLWPQDEAFVRQLVYGETSGGFLSRWDRGFSISAVGMEDVAAQVAAEVSRVTGLPVTVGAGDVVATINEADPYWSGSGAIAYSQNTSQGHRIISSRIVFRNRSAVSVGVFLHEMGHGIGLSHTESPDVMTPYSARPAVAFSERETIALRMMYGRRAAGNGPPDREGAAGSSDVRFRTVIVE